MDDPKLDEGQKVYALLDNETRLEKGTITKVSENLFCTVDFLDGTTSNDVYPTDIKNCECRFMGCNGQHILNSMVSILSQTKKNYKSRIFIRNSYPTPQNGRIPFIL